MRFSRRAGVEMLEAALSRPAHRLLPRIDDRWSKARLTASRVDDDLTVPTTGADDPAAPV